MLKLPNISKPISQFRWIINESNNIENEILFLIVYTKKSKYGAMERKNIIFRIGYLDEEEKNFILSSIKSSMDLAQMDNKLIYIKVDKDHSYIKIFDGETGKKISEDITGFEWKGYE